MGIHEPIPQAQENADVEDEEKLIEGGRRSLSYTKASATDEEKFYEDQRIGGGGSCWPSDSLLRLVAVMAAALFVCAIIMSASYNFGARTMPPPGQLCSYEVSVVCPAAELFVDPELHEVATETLMYVGSGLFSDADRGMVRAIVAQSFRNISSDLRRDAPTVARMLNMVQLTRVQKEAVIGMLRLIGEPRLQRIGFEVAQAIRDNALTHSEPTVEELHVKGVIEQHLLPRRDEIWALRNELVPVALRQFWGEGEPWSMTLRKENLQVMKTVHDDWSNAIGGHREHFEVQLQVTAQALSPAEASQRSYGVFGGVLEEGRALLDMIEIHVHSLGHDLSMPQLAVSISGDESFGAEPLSCDLEQRPAHWFLKAILCPLKFGTQGVDALRAIPSMMHLKKTATNHIADVPQSNTVHDIHNIQDIDDIAHNTQDSTETQTDQENEEGLYNADEESQKEQENTGLRMVGQDIAESQSVQENVETQKPLITRPKCVYKRGQHCTALDLLNNSDVHGMAVHVLMLAASGILRGLFSDEDHKLVHNAVKEGFRNISADIHRYTPDLAGELSQIPISKTEKDVILKLMRLTHDRRLQNLGLDVARALRRSARTALFVKKGMKQEYLRHEIEEMLFPRREEIMKLSEDLFTPRMQEFLGDKDFWSMTLDPFNVQVMETVDDKWDSVLGEKNHHVQERLRLTANAVGGVQPLESLETHFDIFNGVVQEGRFVLDMIKLRANSLGLDLNMPTLAISSDDSDRYGLESVSCDLQEGRAGHWFLKAIVCPLKLGAQGLDAMRAASDIMHFRPNKVNLAFVAAEQQAIFNIIEHDNAREHGQTSTQYCTYAKEAECPAQEMLLNPEFHTVAMETLMQVSSGLFSTEDEPMVQGIVAKGFHNISVELKQVAPDVMSKLNSLKLTLEQKDVVLQLMRLMDEPRVQLIGLEVAKAIRDSVKVHESVTLFGMEYDIKHHIEAVLLPRQQEILKLREELIPEALNKFLGDANQWSLTLHPDNIRVMETVGDGWGHLNGNLVNGEHEHIQVKVQATAEKMAPVEASQKSLGIFAGVLEEGRVLLDVLELHARSLGRNMSMPQLAVAVNSKSKFDSEPVSCDLEKGKSALWFLKAVLCPLKFGAQGLDALRAASKMTIA